MYTRRVIYFDRAGKKHTVFRSMGDVDCSDHETWLSDPVCQETNPGLFPAPAPSAPSAPATSTGIATATAPSSYAPVAFGLQGKTLALGAAIAVGAFYLLKKKRK